MGDRFNKKIAEQRAQLINGLSGISKEALWLKNNMYLRYGDLARAIFSDPSQEGLIRGNADTFIVLCDDTVYKWAYANKFHSSEFKDATIKYTELNNLFSSLRELEKGLIKIKEITQRNSVQVSLESFYKGLQAYNPDNFVPLMDDMDISDEEIFVDDTGYFSAEEQEENNILEAQQNGQGNVDINFNENTDPEDELDPEIESNTARVMNVYRDLYEVGFELQLPYGILTKEGIMRLNNTGKTSIKRSASFEKLYELVNDVSGKFLVQSQIGTSIKTDKLCDIQIRKGTTYYPQFQLANLYGILSNTQVDSWAQFSNQKRQEIRHNIKINLQNGKDIAAIVDSLTSSIVISEFNPNVALKLRISVGNCLIVRNNIESEYAKRKSTIMAGTGELYHIQQLPTGVIEMTLVFNKAAYNGSPLFAYEAVQDLVRRGRHPSLKEMILGQDTSGKIMTVNMNRQNSCVTLIGAGPRSGKGVLTLNLLGTILAGGHPLVYLDGKPDMAKVLWGLGTKHGIKPAVWDVFYENGNTVGAGAPEVMVRENKDIFGILMYLKAVQLMMISAHLRATKNIQVGGADKRPFFIFDEAYAVQATMAGAWKPIIALAKDKKNESEEAKWCRVIVQWGEQLSNSLASTINSQLPMSGISTVWLFQVMQPMSWNAFDTQGLSGSFNILKIPIMARTSIKLLGKGTTDSEFGLGNANIKGNRVVAERIASEGGRHFAYTETQKITDIDSIKIFKPYLVLNEAQNGSSAVEELRNNVSKDVWNAIAPNGSLHPGVGFEGFAKMLGEQAIKNLQLGRNFIEDTLQILGLTNYESVDDYLYDASSQSFKSLGVFLNNQDDTYANSNVYTYRSNIDNFTYHFNPVNSSEKFENPAEEERYEAEIEGVNNKRNVSEYTEDEIRKLFGEKNTDEYKTTIENKKQSACSMSGKDGRRIIVDSTKSRNGSKLTKENSIDCRDAKLGLPIWIEDLMLNTMWGAEKYSNKLWKSILNRVVRNGYRRSYITRVSIYGGQMYVNGKILNLNEVIGGKECIRLRDIMSFKTLFDQFFAIRELRMDEDVFRAAILELGDNAIEMIFKLASKLEVVQIQSKEGNITQFNRSSIINQAAKRFMENGKLKNNIDINCMNKSSRIWNQRFNGDNIWGWKLAKNSLGTAGKMFMDKNKPSVGRAAIYASVGLLAGTIGGAAYGTFRLAKGIYTMFIQFRK